MKIKNLKVGSLRKVWVASTFSLIAASLIGCGETELATNRVDDSSIVDFNTPGGTDFIENGVKRVIEVPGEDFKLVIEYTGELEDNEFWTITSNKKIYTKIYTEGLPEGYEVYLNDIHTDTSILGKQKEMDGIKQDTMDVGVHNSTLPGFLIGDDQCYYGVNQIDGQNDDFIQGSIVGFGSYTSGSVDEQRFLESDYLEKGVYANEISSVYTLLVKGPNENGYRGISVDDDIYVSIYNKISFLDNFGDECIKEYIVDENGEVTLITYTPEGKEKKRTKVVRQQRK